jgi:hypothetical protein
LASSLLFKTFCTGFIINAHSVCHSLIFFFTGNAAVIYVILRSRRMRSITNFFLANLAFADFCVGIFCVLPTLKTYLDTIWTLGRVSTCQVTRTNLKRNSALKYLSSSSRKTVTTVFFFYGLYIIMYLLDSNKCPHDHVLVGWLVFKFLSLFKILSSKTGNRLRSQTTCRDCQGCDK